MSECCRNLSRALVLLFSLSSLSAMAATTPIEYSANAVLSDGANHSLSFKTFVGKDRVRTETTLKGRDIVQIVDIVSNVGWILDPETRTVLEHKGSGPSGPHRPSSMNPCDGRPALKCRALGTVFIKGRETSKWEIINQAKTDAQPIFQWIDKQRLFPVRIEHANGFTELELIGKDHINGRDTEKWQMTASEKDGEPMRGLLWYDPELRTAIREELPGGMIRELKNIRLGPQPESLFTIPLGYLVIGADGKPAEPAKK